MYGDPRDLLSFPTRRSSDLTSGTVRRTSAMASIKSSCPFIGVSAPAATTVGGACSSRVPGDRKSTRLNSSHLVISYAVFCLIKKRYLLRLVICCYLRKLIPL